MLLLLLLLPLKHCHCCHQHCLWATCLLVVFARGRAYAVLAEICCLDEPAQVFATLEFVIHWTLVIVDLVWRGCLITMSFIQYNLGRCVWQIRLVFLYWSFMSRRMSNCFLVLLVGLCSCIAVLLGLVVWCRLLFPSCLAVAALLQHLLDKRRKSLLVSNRPMERICHFYLEGRCTKGVACSFAHRRPAPPMLGQIRSTPASTNVIGVPPLCCLKWKSWESNALTLQVAMSKPCWPVSELAADMCLDWVLLVWVDIQLDMDARFSVSRRFTILWECSLLTLNKRNT